MNISIKHLFNPSRIYLLKVNNRNSRARCGKCSKLTIKTPEHVIACQDGINQISFSYCNTSVASCQFFVLLSRMKLVVARLIMLLYEVWGFGSFNWVVDNDQGPSFIKTLSIEKVAALVLVYITEMQTLFASVIANLCFWNNFRKYLSSLSLITCISDCFQKKESRSLDLRTFVLAIKFVFLRFLLKMVQLTKSTKIYEVT